MENTLITNSNESIKTIDSREVAEMMEKAHGDLLKDIQGSGKNLGIIPTLTEGNFPVVDYFVESSYVDSKGETRKCYMVTKMGCELLGNKLQGKKGILFSASYVKRFNVMEKQIQKTVLSFQIEDPVLRAEAWIKEYKASQQLLAEKNEIIEELSPFAKIARERMDKTGTISFTDVTQSYELKKGQFSCWAKIKGYINRSGNGEVNQSGQEYFKTIVDKQGFKSVAIREEGLKLVDKFIADIKETPCRFNMKLVQE
jgi:anti-repressor protein